MKKKIAVAVSLLLVLALSVGGTIAWLTDSDSVTNTFTIGDIDITLAEPNGAANNKYKITPGATVEKDPTVTVVKGSENCYVYVCVTNTVMVNIKADTASDAVPTVVATPNIDSTNWTVVGTGTNKVLYRYINVVDASKADVMLPAVFATVTYSDKITKDNISEITAEDKIIIEAFAHQSDSLTDGVNTADAEANAKFGTTKPTP